MARAVGVANRKSPDRRGSPLPGVADQRLKADLGANIMRTLQIASRRRDPIALAVSGAGEGPMKFSSPPMGNPPRDACD
jgi:hypothetical protein